MGSIEVMECLEMVRYFCEVLNKTEYPLASIYRMAVFLENSGFIKATQRIFS